jgi:hypothetical protein
MYNTHTAPPSSELGESGTPIIPHLAEGAISLELISVSWQDSVELIFPNGTYCGDPKHHQDLAQLAERGVLSELG